MNPVEVNEVTDQFTQKAKEALQALEKIEGKKALAIVLDDIPSHSEYMVTVFEHANRKVNATFVALGFNYGEDAITAYKAFKKADSKDNPNNVILLLDGNLSQTDKYKFGAEVVREISRISAENGWTMPYLIGMSNMEAKNKELANQYPDVYITSYDKLEDTLPILQAVESKLVSHR